MREIATLTVGFCAVSLLTGAPVQAQGLDASFADASSFAANERPVLTQAEVARAEAETWITTVDRVPAPQLAAPPREVRAPRPKLAARPADGLSKPAGKHDLSGIASYYWQDQMTASGERFNKRDMTAAHRSLPFGTKVRVFCANTGREVVVRINDRGPFKPGRVIDLSEAAAEAIGMTRRGLTTVQLEVVRN